MLLWLVLVASLGHASALTPGAMETRVWQKSSAPLELHQAEASQPLDLRQANASCGYELAPESLLAAKGGGKVSEGIYEFTGQSGKRYVGESGDLPRRIGQHARSGKLPAGGEVSTTEVLGGRTAREVAEQRRINELGGVRNLENIRNPIGPNRQHLLGGGN